VEAGTRVLDSQGWSGFTTNEVAEVAGISIGSLYQYFPNKLALVDAIRRRHFDDVLTVLRRACESRRGARDLVAEFVGNMIGVHSKYPALHRTLRDLPNPDGTRSTFEAFQEEYLHLYGALVAVFQGNRDGKVNETIVQILSSAVEGVIHNAARREVLTQPKIKRELIKLMCCYLDVPS
jgi:AcrR family transcriptional regulator